MKRERNEEEKEVEVGRLLIRRERTNSAEDQEEKRSILPPEITHLFTARLHNRDYFHHHQFISRPHFH
jgi:hypothetical protein